jgi:hypothetical protein
MSRDRVRNAVGRFQRRALVLFRVCEAPAVRLSGQRRLSQPLERVVRSTL